MLSLFPNQFLFNFPDGGLYENCAILSHVTTSWNDFSCDDSLCHACDMPRVTTVRIRGMCLKSRRVILRSSLDQPVHATIIYRVFVKLTRTLAGE